jgi:hypothetical protein
MDYWMLAYQGHKQKNNPVIIPQNDFSAFCIQDSPFRFSLNSNPIIQSSNNASIRHPVGWIWEVLLISLSVSALDYGAWNLYWIS